VFRGLQILTTGRNADLHIQNAEQNLNCIQNRRRQMPGISVQQPKQLIIFLILIFTSAMLFSNDPLHEHLVQI
jgi:hypothetical protein